ncbi:hypothetical protein QYM36_000902 [Artemia franciscana]|uniref:Uncharacterized protein n=1 Tax=Artemia franciscana TaxID=6661 RepID=A0AA88LHH5_ARTSF|nr:hypothetical protein QYM36_000902 [Artemia franciscana]
MSKPDPPDPYLEGSHAKPKSNNAMSPSQVTKPAKNENDKTEKATARQPSRPSTSGDGTMISVGSPQWSEPNCQLPDDENHLAWDDFQKLRKEFNLFINRNGEAEIFANDAACLTSLLDLTHIGNMKVTSKPKEQLIQKETRLAIYNIPSLYTDNDIQEGLTDSSLLSYPLKSITSLKKRNENNEIVASNCSLCI